MGETFWFFIMCLLWLFLFSPFCGLKCLPLLEVYGICFQNIVVGTYLWQLKLDINIHGHNIGFSTTIVHWIKKVKIIPSTFLCYLCKKSLFPSDMVYQVLCIVAAMRLLELRKYIYICSIAGRIRPQIVHQRAVFSSTNATTKLPCPSCETRKLGTVSSSTLTSLMRFHKSLWKVKTWKC